MAEDTPNLSYLAMLLTPPNRPKRMNGKPVVPIVERSKLLFLKRAFFKALHTEL